MWQPNDAICECGLGGNINPSMLLWYAMQSVYNTMQLTV